MTDAYPPKPKNIKDRLRWMLSWMCYWIGDAFSKIALNEDSRCIDIRFALFYDLYSWFIVASANIQGDTDYGPWRKGVDELGYWKILCCYIMGKEKGMEHYWDYDPEF